jgi:anaerobic selenocysteine-containing dehydrogenase
MTRSTHIFTCNLCESACGLRVELEDGAQVTRIRGNPDDVISHGHICAKAHGLGELFDDPHRLRQPMARVGEAWQPVSWEDALDEAASRLRTIQKRYGRDAVAIYVGNPVVHAHRASLGSQLLTAAIGSHNRFDPNAQDSNPRLFAALQVYGDPLAIPVPDVDRTQFLLILGANPFASNGSQMVLGDAKQRLNAIRARGGQLVVVDPRRTETAAAADWHLAIRPGGDAVLILAMLHVILADGLRDPARVAELASGLEELRDLVRRFPPERVAARIGLEAEKIRHLARAFAQAPSAVAYARVGVCQSPFGLLGNWLTEVLNLVTGNLDAQGGALFPVASADIGPIARLLLRQPMARWHSRVRGLPEFLGSLPSAVMAEEMLTGGLGQIRALVCLAGNPVLSTPNGPQLAGALQNLEYMVGIDFYRNETTQHAHLLLPPKHVFETGHFPLLTHRFGVRHALKYSPAIAQTDDDTRDEWHIATELALRMRMPRWLHKTLRKWLKHLPEQLIDLLLRVGPQRMRLKTLAENPNGLDFGPLRAGRLAEVVRTDDKRARLMPEAYRGDIVRLEAWLDAPADLTLPGKLELVGRRHVRDNNSWMHNLKSVVKGPDRARLHMHPDDAAARGLVDGQQVVVTSRVGKVEVQLQVTETMRCGVLSLPHGFGHADTHGLPVARGLAGPNKNALTDEMRVEPILGSSILNGVPVRVEAKADA